MPNGNIRYAFGFQIKLHIDDLNVLKLIHETLGIGRLANPQNNTASYQVNSEKDLRILLDIFDKYPLL